MEDPPSVVQLPVALYIGDLNPDIDDGKLQEVFAPYNPTSVHVCMDSLTQKSLGYGYVNFTTPEDAKHAIKKLNHTPVAGKVIRIMWSHRDNEARKSGVGNLFVKNIHSSIDNVGLHEIFSRFGTILSCKVAMTPDGDSKGYGFVQFESEDSAKAAIENLNGSLIGGEPLYVSNFVKKSDRVYNSGDNKYTNLYMKNLDRNVTEELLKEKFSEFGRIISLIILKDNNGNSRGFGFVNFERQDDAKRAIQEMNGTQLGSKVLYVAEAQKKEEREQYLHHLYEERHRRQGGLNLYVKNLDDDVDEDELREFFSGCGEVTSCKLMRDDKGTSRGFGFVCFSTSDEANKAVSTLHRSLLHDKLLYVAIAQRKEDRQAQLQIQFAQRMAEFTSLPAPIYPPGFSPHALVNPGRRPRYLPPIMPPYMALPNTPMPGWMNMPYMPPLQQFHQSVDSSKNSSNRQWGHMPYGDMSPGIPGLGPLHPWMWRG